ncbi:MAG: hypothetical protein LBI28_01230 [Treponema sp.]|jgi:hypothetical protein|nr:hypothetical protein [Treponema sp.]
MSKKIHNDSDGNFRFLDFLVILLCLSGALFLVNMFRVDLFSTLDSKNEQPVGTIVIKNNIVQRRLANRVLWDRLVVDSPAYMGDLIRTADLSEAMLHIGSSSIELGERTLIRIQRSPDGSIQIDLQEGNVVFIAGAGGEKIALSIMGRKVEAVPGTILSASAGIEDLTVKVSEGTAYFNDNEQRREISSGSMIALSAAGQERIEKVAVAIKPHPNARYLKNGTEPLPVNFSWNSLNLDPAETLRMEISNDRNFNRIIHVIENIDATAGVSPDVSLDSGIWYWRLTSTKPGVPPRVISTERLIVTSAEGPPLLSPVKDSLFLYHNDLPQIRFQWSEVEGASSYIMEASESPNFVNPRLRIQTTSVFLFNSSLDQGTWYWRVMPVFPSVYEGNPTFSPASSFRIEQGGPDEVGLVLPDIAREPPTPRLSEPVPIRLSLLSPSAGTSIAGLTALRQQTVFRWNGDGTIVRSRFILSQNRNPLQGRPAVEIINPGNTIRLNRLGEGTYYWTVEAQSPDGLISAAEPRQLRILAVPLLPAPGNLQPLAGHRIGLEELKAQANIAFSWSAVQGANAYIITIYEQTDSGRRQIIQRPPENRTSWTLDNLATVGRGTFVWQVEAVNRNSAGAIDQRGRMGESTFVIDIPRPGQIQAEDPGTLYGF